MTEQNINTSQGKQEVIKQIKIGDLTVSEDGTITGYIPVEAREHIDFQELMEEADQVTGVAAISFLKDKEQDSSEDIDWGF